MQLNTLTERLADWNANLQVDRESRLVRNVALTGADSKNGYRYTEAALTSALPLYQHKPVFLDHAADKSRPRERSTRDLVGSICSVRFEQGRIRGDIRVLDTDSGRTFLALVDGEAPGVGMSHVVLARRSPDGATVESIEDVISVDAVVNPATTATFRESANSAPQSPATAVAGTTSSATEPTRESSPLNPQPSTLNDSNPSQLSTLNSSFIDLKSRVTNLTLERDRLAARLRSLEAHREQEVRAQRMDALLSQSRLPDFALTPAFRQQLESAPDDQTRNQLIQERHTLITQARSTSPSSLERPPLASESPSSTAAFLAAVKRKR
jgi:hypothetical protein